MATFWSFVFLAAVVPLALAYPSGAPASACGHLTPGHRANQTLISPQSGPSPYTITVNKDRYSPSESLTVSVTGQSFQGILLQARSVSDDSLVGMFSDPPTDTKLLRCTRDADSITHANKNPKSAGTSFTWVAPNRDAGNITFTATVLQEYEVFWVKLTSQEVASGAPWVTVNAGLIISLLCVVFHFTQQ